VLSQNRESNSRKDVIFKGVIGVLGGDGPTFQKYGDRKNGSSLSTNMTSIGEIPRMPSVFGFLSGRVRGIAKREREGNTKKRPEVGHSDCGGEPHLPPAEGRGTAFRCSGEKAKEESRKKEGSDWFSKRAWSDWALSRGGSLDRERSAVPGLGGGNFHWEWERPGLALSTAGYDVVLFMWLLILGPRKPNHRV